MRVLSVITMVFASCILLVSGAPVSGVPQTQGTPGTLLVSSFVVTDMPAESALLQLSKEAHLPMGIVIQDERLCRTRVSFSAEKIPALTVVSGIASQVHGYAATERTGSPLVMVAPESLNPSTSQFLGLVDQRYKVGGNLETLATMLWVHVLAILHPDQGTAGSILGSTNDKLFTLELTDAPVEKILDGIAVKTSGTWVLRPLPSKLNALGPEPPFEILSEVGQFTSNPADLCEPVRTAN